MILVDGDATWIPCILIEIELITLSRVHLYRLYRLHENMEVNDIDGAT
jgi:hypothetical protein